MSRVTLKTIADETGYSVTTVSRALAGYDDVSERTRHLVQQTAERLGYYPNFTARQLQSQRTQAIGFVLPHVSSQFSDPFFAQLVAGICDTLAAHHYDLRLAPLSAAEGEVAVYRRLVRGHVVDGLLLIHGRRHDERIAYLHQHDVPFVLFGRTQLALDYPYIDVDGRVGTFRLMEHIIAQGHRHIAYLALPRSLTHGWARYEGFRQALEAHGLRPAYVAEGDLTQASAEPFVAHVLGLPTPPTAIIAANDLMALGVLDSLTRRGIRPGEDVAVAGFDDIPTAHIFGLTTVSQPIYAVGKRMTAMLMRLINGDEPPDRQIVLTPQVVIRSSSG
jgi:LacI family transcriptional regulator